MKVRSRGVHLTTEARFLRFLRASRGLSMRAAGELCGKTDSYISQIEHGRMNVPDGDDLSKLLEVYEALPVETFKTRASRYREKTSPKDEIIELIQKTNEVENTMILKIVRALIA